MIYSARVTDMHNKKNRFYIHRHENENNNVIVDTNLHGALNTSGNFTFSILWSNSYYDRIEKPMKQVVDVLDDDGDIVWRGRITNVNSDFYNQKEVECEGVMSFLADTIVQPVKFNGVLAKSYLKVLIELHNNAVFDEDIKKFELGDVDEDLANKNVYIASGYNTTLEMISSGLIKKFGGYITCEPRDDGYIKLHYTKNPRGSKLKQRIEFGVNLINLNKSMDMSQCCTALIPLGASGMKQTFHPDIKDETVPDSPGTNPTGSSMIDAAIYYACAIALDDRFGYNNTTVRWGRTYDCASFMFEVWDYAGAQTRRKNPWGVYSGFTALIKPVFTTYAAARFVDVGNAGKNFWTGEGLFPGDVLVCNTAGYDHAAMYIGNGKVVEAKDPGSGIVIGPVYGQLVWDQVLRLADRNTPADIRQEPIPYQYPFWTGSMIQPNPIGSVPLAQTDEEEEEKNEMELMEVDLDSRLTIEDVNDGKCFVTLTGDEMPECGWIYRTATNDDITDPDALKQWGIEELESYTLENLVLEVDAVDLSGQNSDERKVFWLGDTVVVRSDRHMDKDFEKHISVVDIDITNPLKSKYTIGIGENAKISGVYR